MFNIELLTYSMVFVWMVFTYIIFTKVLPKICKEEYKRQKELDNLIEES